MDGGRRVTLIATQRSRTEVLQDMASLHENRPGILSKTRALIHRAHPGVFPYVATVPSGSDSAADFTVSGSRYFCGFSRNLVRHPAEQK
jgi:hypothetical protein